MFWNITNEDLAAAQAGNTTALARVYDESLSVCVRVATTLAGRRDVAAKAIGELVKRSTRQVEHWRDAEDASRWFMHHTLLMVREYRKPIDPDTDVLLHEVGGPDVVQYRALVHAVRKLPDQQQEAFLLTHAQRWNTRLCAVAMDCSNTAVENHLSEANRQVQPLSGTHFSALAGFLHQVHKTIPIDTPTAPALIAAKIKSRRGLRVLRNIVGWILILALVTAIIAGVVLIGPRIEI